MPAASAAPPLADVLLPTNTHLIIECHAARCRRRVRLRAAEACELLGPNARFGQLHLHLVCSACGARGRDGEVSAHPCTLDDSAWRAREQARAAAERGEQLPWDLERVLATYRQLLSGGELGGDGPVQWPAEPASKGV